MVHALSIAVEDWYHDFLVDPRTPRASRVEANTLGVLDILEAHGVRRHSFSWRESSTCIRGSLIRGRPWRHA
jgi:hypothetical protein